MKTLPSAFRFARILAAAVLLPTLPLPAQAPSRAGAQALPATSAPDLFAPGNLAAWCIVPFDKAKRSPEERAAMLQELGFTKFVYDYRAEHVPEWDRELEALKRHNVQLLGWWFPGSLNPDALKALELFRKHNVKPQLWVSGGGGSLAAGSPEEQARRVAAELKRLRPIADAAKADGLKVGLYNHGSWFGEPENQIEIIEALRAEGVDNVGIVYNQHHGHSHTDRFQALLQKMLPHLLCLNLNGMDPKGDTLGRKILPLGAGSLDVELLKILRESGYAGPVGILNHTGEDAALRLRDNLEGLRWLAPQTLGKPADAKPIPRTFNPSGSTPPAASSSPNAASGVDSLSPAFGKALQGRISAPGRPEYRALPLTVECRVKLNSAKAFNILVASDTKASAEHWELYSFSGSGFFSVYLPGRGGAFSTNSNICDGNWHTVAAVIGPNTLRLFVDGKLAKEAALRPLSGTPVPGGLAIGSLVEQSIGCDGILDEVRISSGERTISEPSSAPLQRDATTLDLWNFDELPPAQNRPPTPAASASPPEPDSGRVRVLTTQERGALPAQFVLAAAAPEKLTPTNGWPATGNQHNWERSLGGPTSNRYSELTQINRDNVASLEVAWTYRSGDGAGNVQCNPIIVDGTLYAPTPGRHIVALDARTGAERWRFLSKSLTGESQGTPARRGLLYWKGDADNSPRLLYGDGNWLVALNPADGKPLSTFGEGGKTRVPMGTTVVGAMYGHVCVLPGYGGDVYGFDARSGALLWTFKTRPAPGEYGHETWSRVEAGANCWGGMAMDESRGIAFVALGSPKPNFFGVNHQGDNLFSNCVVALDALSGRRLWHFQELRHDIWDWDIPAPPNLVTVERHGRRVDAVAQVTKIGNTLLLDRLTGEPLFDVRFRRADTRALPGDAPAPYQPAPELPEPFARQAYTRADLPAHPEARAAFLPLFERALSGPFPSFDEARPTLLFNIHGGAEWTGAAADPRGFLYVSSNEVPWSITCFRDDDPAPALPPSPGEQVYQTHCAACHAPDRKGVGHAPPLRGLRHRLAEGEIRSLLLAGRASMPPMPHLSETQLAPLLDFLLCRDRPLKHNGPAARPEWTFSGFQRAVDLHGYPACSPPWGTLNCINLNTGKIAWRVPLGEYPELSAQGLPATGQENFGGAMVTAGKLVFVSGTRDRKIRAFDSDSGRELWSRELPQHGTAQPATYMAGNTQFLVLAATGGGKLGGPTGDHWVAFALKNRP